MFCKEKAALQIDDSKRKWQHLLNFEMEELYAAYAKEVVEIALIRRDLHIRTLEEARETMIARRQPTIYVPLRPSVQLAKGTLVLRWVANGGRKWVKKGDDGPETITTKYSRTIMWKRSSQYEKMRPKDWLIPEKRFEKLLTDIDRELVPETEAIFGHCRAAWMALTKHRLAHQAPALRFEALLPWQTPAMEARHF